MFGARWHKVFYDLWGNKTRSSLIVLSIAVGLFAVGVIVNARVSLARDMAQGYEAINPSHGSIQTIEPFGPDFVGSIRQLEGVADADGRAHISVRFRVQRDGAQEGPIRWRDLQLFAVPDYEAMRVNRIWPQSGDWPPPPQALLVERAALDLMGARVGDVVLIETGAQGLRELPIAGTVHDMAQMPAVFNNMPYGYVSFDTLAWLGEPSGLNELHVVVQHGSEVQATVNRVKDWVEASGYTIPISFMAKPGEFPLDDMLQAALLLLGALGALSLLTSGFLIVNTISALVTQQSQQIGTLKAVGARGRQVVGLYLSLVLAYASLALVLALPSSLVGARALGQLMADFFNFDLGPFRLVPQAVGLQIGLGLLVPVLAALYPTWRVTRVTAAEALRDDGLGQDRFGSGLLDRLLTGHSTLLSRWLSRPLTLSLRNTFRRKGRLALTLLTLTLGGAMFISVFSLRASLSRTLDDVMQAYQADLWVNFAQLQPEAEAKEAALAVDGVVGASAWARMPARRVRADGGQGELLLFAVSPESGLFAPVLVEGRWLSPDDGDGLVISTGVLANEPDIQLGDEVVIKVRGRETTFRVVGVAIGLGLAPIVYADYERVAQVVGEVGQTRSLALVTEGHDRGTLLQTAATLEADLKRAGLRVNAVQLVSEESVGAEVGFGIVITLALVMALLVALVGGLGLMGTLSINALERTREIGVMRAIGAADGTVARVFITEGMLIGLFSWLLGTLGAVPLSQVLSDVVGQSLLQAPLNYSFALDGALIWLGVGLGLSALASFWPARKASRLTVREVLACA